MLSAVLGLVPAELSAQPGAEGNGRIILDRQSLLQAPVRLDDWLYRSAEDLSAPPESSQPGWSPQSSRLTKDKTPDDWSGSGWFSTIVEIDPDVVGQPLGLRIHPHYGASKILIDGTAVAEIGLASADPTDFRPSMRPHPIFFELDQPGRHEILVLFHNPELRRYHRVAYPAGFRAALGLAADMAAVQAAEARRYAGQRGLFTGVFLSFALLHLLLFAFRPQSRENLDFAIFCTCLAVVVFLLAHKGLSTDPRIVFWSEGAMNLAALLFAASGVTFVHRVFTGGTPRWLRRLALLLLPALVWSLLWPGAALGMVFLVMLLGLIEMTRTVIIGVRRGAPGVGIVGAGIGILALGFGAGVLANMGILPAVQTLTFAVPFASVFALIVSMSVYLSRRYAHTQRDLEEQIEQVRVLSEQKLAEERRMREQLIQNELLESELTRRGEELEEARRLQLSMLPQSLPEHPQLQLAAFMETATEVGGDYYDFDVGEEGELTLAIGDATGHGMRAGTMVTATKSLFNALAADEDLVATVKRSNLAIKRMNLRNLNMAFLLARVKDGRLRVSAAGMPQPLIYRRQRNAIEVLEVGGMPLGSMRSFPYQNVEAELAAGDTVLLMSDGFPERANPHGEQLGYERTAELFLELSGKEPQELIDGLVAAGKEWAQGTELDDDVTFVVFTFLG